MTDKNCGTEFEVKAMREQLEHDDRERMIDIKYSLRMIRDLMVIACILLTVLVVIGIQIIDH